MAWQLIYTSAPRSLEAGRSGFGTVARHRAISPLLVSAIERTSQFSRLPGVDTGRVIFSHRIVAVAGGRFHVLSSIRDAGADYTGRTNHIAHHLIADAREIAQLGANGPSPADVLLAMQWATSWTEHPRYFEAADEIALATLHPQTNGAAWQRITGNPNQAWLLASGDASRGAYVIQPAGTDLRAVFAESLRLIPERLWQISFTTSLQPSDEPADFRWIGIEERSPLRAQTESSGRPTLNLAAPSTLPLVEMVQPAAASPIRQNFAPGLPSFSTARQTALPEASPVITLRSSSNVPHEKEAESQKAPVRSTLRSRWKWGVTVATLAVVAALALGVSKHAMKWWNERKDLTESLQRSGYFPTASHAAGYWQVARMNSSEVSILQAKVQAFNRLTEALQGANFQQLEASESNNDLDMVLSVASWGGLSGQIKEILRLKQLPQAFNSAPDAATMGKIVDQQRAEFSQTFSKMFPNSNAIEWQKRLSTKFHREMLRQEALGLKTLLQNRFPPPEGVDAFEKAINEFAKLTSDTEALETVAKIKRMLSEQTKHQATFSQQAPVAVPETKTPVDSPLVTSPAVTLLLSHGWIYVASSSKLPVECVISQLVEEMEFDYIQGKEIPTKLSRNPTTALWRDMRKSKDFEVNYKEKKVTAVGKDLGSEFELAAYNSPRNERVFTFYVRSATSPPLVPDDRERGVSSIRLIAANGTLSLDDTGRRLVDKVAQSLVIQTPPDFSSPGDPGGIETFDKGVLNLRSFAEGLTIRQGRLNDEITERENALQKPASGAEFTQAQENTFVGLVSRLSEKGKKLLASNESPPHTRCGGLLAAFGEDWGSDRLGEPGKKLRSAADARSIEEALRAAKQAIDLRLGELSSETKNIQERSQQPLRDLSALINHATTIYQQTLEAGSRRAELNKQLVKLRQQLELVKQHPLARGKAPGGPYRVMIKLDTTTRIPLVDLELPKP